GVMVTGRSSSKARPSCLVMVHIFFPEKFSHADGWADSPPIFFLRHQKENAPRPVEKKKCSAGRSAQAQTSCRRRGKVGCSLRQSETETRCPWGILQSGEVQGYTLRRFSLPLAWWLAG